MAEGSGELTTAAGAATDPEGEAAGKIEGLRLSVGTSEFISELEVGEFLGETIKVAGLKIFEQETNKGRKTKDLRGFWIIVKGPNTASNATQ